jgi:hypothetical protein
LKTSIGHIPIFDRDNAQPIAPNRRFHHHRRPGSESFQASALVSQTMVRGWAARLLQQSRERLSMRSMAWVG